MNRTTIDGTVTTYKDAIDYRTGSPVSHIWITTDSDGVEHLRTTRPLAVKVGDRVQVSGTTITTINGIATDRAPVIRVAVTDDRVIVTIGDKAYPYTIDDPKTDRFRFIQWAKQDATYRATA